MKTFKFEIILTERELEGDEFWEECLEKDGTGIAVITECMERAVNSEFFPMNADDIKEVVQLKSFTEDGR